MMSLSDYFPVLLTPQFTSWSSHTVCASVNNRYSASRLLFVCINSYDLSLAQMRGFFWLHPLIYLIMNMVLAPELIRPQQYPHKGKNLNRLTIIDGTKIFFWQTRTKEDLLNCRLMYYEKLTFSIRKLASRSTRMRIKQCMYAALYIRLKIPQDMSRIKA